MNIQKLQFSHAKLISNSLYKQISVLVFSVFIFESLLLPMPGFAKFVDINNYYYDKGQQRGYLPENPDRELKIKYTKYTTITAYNSIPAQTDSTPCITANGFNLCTHNKEDSVAANFLRFGTKIRIPEIFGDRVFVVRDRMNARYSNRVDVWMINKEDALKLGKRLAKIEILE